MARFILCGLIALCCVCTDAKLYNYGEAGKGKKCTWNGHGTQGVKQVEELYWRDPCDGFWCAAGSCVAVNCYWGFCWCSDYEHGRRRRVQATRWITQAPNYECTNCGAGRYMSLESTHRAACSVCPRGKHGRSSASRTQCDSCPLGRYSKEDEAANAAACPNCAAGQYRSEHLKPNGNAQTCAKCPAGKHQQGSVFSKCVACDGAGQYQNLLGQNSCKPCGANPVNDHKECKCAAGTSGTLAQAEAGTCPTCGAGQWHNNQNLAAKCKSCPAGKYAQGPGPNTGCQRCSRGRFHNKKKQTSSTACTLCPAGTYQKKDESSRAGCMNCPDGLASDARRYECKGCAAGKHLKKVVASTQYDAGPADTNKCDPGFSRVMDAAECKRWADSQGVHVRWQYACTAPCGWGASYPRGCQVDQGKANSRGVRQQYVYYNPHNTGGCGSGCKHSDSYAVCAKHTKSSMTCEACRAGRYQDLSYTTEQSCKGCGSPRFVTTKALPSQCRMCHATNAIRVDDYTCKCKAGRYGDGASCTACPTGRFMDAPNNAAECVSCPQGQISDPNPFGATRCGCSAGERRTNGACKACQKGRYNSAAFHVGSCTLCGAGTYGTKRGQTNSATACIACEAGKYHTAQRKECLRCPIGLAGNTARTGCACVAGKYTANCSPNSATCTCAVCDMANKFQPGANTVFEYQGHDTNYQLVMPAAAMGVLSISPTVAISLASNRASTCHYDCAHSKRVSDDGLRCECPAGKFRSGSDTCEDCEPGTYRAVPNNLSNCADCSPGEFMPIGGHNAPIGFTDCKDCPSGKWAGNPKATTCSDKRLCDAGEGQMGANGDKNDDGGTTKDRECADCIPVELHPTKKDQFGNAQSKFPRQSPNGSWSATKDDQPCEDNILCGPEEYEFQAPSPTQKRICRTHAASCPLTQYQVSAPTAHDDRGCTPLETCNPGWMVASHPQLNQPGGWYIAPRVCSKCPAGQWSSSTNASSCTKCDAGTYHNGADPSTSAEVACTQCEGSRGEYQDTPGRSQCKTCDPGRFRDVNVLSKHAVELACPACGAGEYQKNSAKTSCDDCLAGKFQDQDEPDYASNAAACKSCSAAKGEYQPQDRQTQCLTCAAGRYRDVLALSSALLEVACPSCSPGWYQDKPAHLVCTACSAGMYQDTTIDDHEELPSACVPCEVGKGEYQPLQGKITCRTCGKGKYRDVNIAADAEESTACSACLAADGAFMDEEGISRTQWNTCKVCQKGKFRNANISSDRPEAEACEVCAGGQHQEADAATSCMPCSAGTFQDQEKFADWSKNSLACTPCQAGSYAKDEGQLNCVQCKPGLFQDTVNFTDALSNPAACRDCLVGKYQPDEGKTSCKACEACNGGEQLVSCGATDKGTCTQCNAGFVKKGKGNWNDTCNACEPALYQPSKGQETCFNCQKGKYRLSSMPPSSAEEQACNACHDGQYQDGHGTVDGCKSCQKGTYQDTKLANYVSDPSACVACIPGYYQQHEAQTHCHACVHGRYQDNTIDQHAEKPAACVDCANGQYQEQAGSTKCESCSVGKYQDMTANDRLYSETACEDCDHGRFQSTPGSAGVEACATCPAGQFPNVVQDQQLLDHFRRGHFDKDWHAGSRPHNFHGSVAAQHYVTNDGTEASGPDEGMLVPIGQSYAFCRKHNTGGHVCHERRWCEAAPGHSNDEIPPANVGPRAHVAGQTTHLFAPHPTHYVGAPNLKDWCDFQCASAPDRWLKPFCPAADGTPGSLCQCHEKRAPTVDVSNDAEDKQCNHAHECSHVTCKLEMHSCDTASATHKSGHLWHKEWARSHGYQVSHSRCDTGSHKSVRVFHHGAETTCRLGHHCFVRGDECVCMQNIAEKPDADRCWYDDLVTQASLRACYRRCHHDSDSRACKTLQDANFSDVQKPTLSSCPRTQEYVAPREPGKYALDKRQAHHQLYKLCKMTAYDDIDGILTDKVVYTIVKQDDNVPKLICDKCEFGFANIQLRHMLMQQGQGAAGVYFIKAKVCDSHSPDSSMYKCAESPDMQLTIIAPPALN